MKPGKSFHENQGPGRNVLGAKVQSVCSQEPARSGNIPVDRNRFLPVGSRDCFCIHSDDIFKKTENHNYKFGEQDMGPHLRFIIFLLVFIVFLMFGAQRSWAATCDAYIGESHLFEVSATDPDGDNLYYMLDWGEGVAPERWPSSPGTVGSGITQQTSHIWTTPKSPYVVTAYAYDTNNNQSPISNQISLNVCDPDAPGGLKGDLNNNGRLDVLDANACAYLFLANPPVYNPQADMNDDMVINIFDVQLIVIGALASI